MSKWSFHASDWVTAVDVIRGRYIFAGSRDGNVYVLNWYGACLATLSFESWVGALRLVTIRTGLIEHLYLLVGTKTGDFTCLKASESDILHFEIRYKLNVGNTIRAIDVTDALSRTYNVQIAFGSENRKVYILNLADAESKGSAAQIVTANPNGWIRSVAFCRSVRDELLVAAGCGDKHLHLFDLNGEEYASIDVASKIHTLISSLQSPQIYCASDAKQLYVISPKAGRSYYIEKVIPLPHRAITLDYTTQRSEQLLVACADHTLYLFDLLSRKLVSCLPIRESVFALREASDENGRAILVGHGQRTLSCMAYSIEPKISTSARTVERGHLDNFKSEDLTCVSEAWLYGPKAAQVEVGIGRFLHVVERKSGIGPLVIVATDEGRVVVLDIADEEKPKLVSSYDLPNCRVWAVYGWWARTDVLRIMAATSANSIVGLNAHFLDGQDVNWEVHENHHLNDWPREIRGVNGLEVECSVAACENGDIRFLGCRGLDFNAGEVFRTVCARSSAGNIEVLTGSDDNRISFYRNGALRWSRPTADRVRETIFDGERTLSVSEDRFLYAIDIDGRLDFRFRFPHRALCVDVFKDEDGDKQYVVGCGDGYVYFISQSRVVRSAFEFPDRIRDVRIVNDNYLLVASESFSVHVALLPHVFMKKYYADRHTDFVKHQVAELEKRFSQDGPMVLSDVPHRKKIYLLGFVDMWMSTANAEMFLALLDSVVNTVSEVDNIREFYVISHALAKLALHVDFAVGRSRIERFLRDTNDFYASHAMVSLIGEQRLGEARAGARIPDAKALVEVITSEVDLSDVWVLEEAIRNLYVSEFFSLAESGLFTHFRRGGLQYARWNRIMATAAQLDSSDLMSTTVTSLLRALAHERQDAALIISSCKPALDLGDGAATLAAAVAPYRIIDAIDIQDVAVDGELRATLESWLRRGPISEGLRGILERMVDELSAERRLSERLCRLMVDSLELRMYDVKEPLTATDYIYLLLFKGLLRVIATSCNK